MASAPKPDVVEGIDCADGRTINVAFRGDRFFNTASLIEAADTPPSFHNNIVETIEEAGEFYTTDAFNNSVSGGGNAFVFKDDQINQIAALLRALNVLDNIRSGNEYDWLALRVPSSGRRPPRGVSSSSPSQRPPMRSRSSMAVQLFGPNVDKLLRDARALEVRAIDQQNPKLVEEAIAARIARAAR